MADTVSDTDQLEIATTAPCYLLDIAAELRNQIYELAFTTNETEVDLHRSKPPSSALLLCCKQISKEATGIFKTSTRDYYETKHFVLAVDRDEALVKFDQAARTFDLQSMKHLRLEFDYTIIGVRKVFKITIDTNRSLWHFENPGQGPPYHFIFVHRLGTSKHFFAVPGESEAERDEHLALMTQSLRCSVVTSIKDQFEAFCKSRMGLTR